MEHTDDMQNGEVYESVAARRLARMGGNEAPPPPMPEEPPTWQERLSNIWYHYKFHILAALFVALCLAVLIPQCMTASTVHDLEILYAGPAYDKYNDKQVMEDLENAFASLLSDYGEASDERSIFIRSLLIMSDDQYEAAREDKNYIVNPNFLQEQRRLFRDEVATGKTVICLLDPALAEELKEEGWLLSLDPLLGSAQIPAYAPLKDGETVYGVRLFDTEFGKYFDGVNELPRDTVLCMRKMGVLAPKENSEEIYAATNHALRRLFAFTIPEGEGDLYS